MAEARIIICDDESEILRYLTKILQGHGYQVETFESGELLLQRMSTDSGWRMDLLVQDVHMPGVNGIEVLKQIRLLRPELPVVMMTAYGSIDSAVETIKLGAYDYVTKPFPKEKLLGVLEKALERETLLKENRRLTEELVRSAAPGEIIFASDTFRQLYQMTLQVAASQANILIQGESGTGKELIARAIHYYSPRRERRYQTINCAALVESLLESQLFGHVRGAFTGANSAHKGLLEAADGGTLFLDEIGDMSLALQAKLLRVIQEREFLPVGATTAKSTDIRIVAATNKDLAEEVHAGRFREDLFYRLNVICLQTAPLRERREDVEPLAQHFMARFAQRMKKRVDGITPEALQLLREYHWPGNVRELENIIERAVILMRGTSITPDLLPVRRNLPVVLAPAAEEGGDSLADAERRHIVRLLEKTGYHKSRTADLLGITRKTLDRKIEEYKLSVIKHRAEKS